MAKLTTGQRKALPSKVFAGPNRSFPIPDKAHAVAAERLVGRAEKAGSINANQAATIKAKAKAKLGKASPKPRTHGILKPTATTATADRTVSINAGGTSLSLHARISSPHLRTDRKRA